MRLYLTFALLFAMASLGCEGSKTTSTSASSSSPKSTSSTESPKAASLTPEVIAKLVQADRLDGDEDHVIKRCYICGLGMDGKEKFAASYGDYTAHLCSKGCQSEFEASPESVVADTAIPKSKD
jgi:YHS domain-containing protein